MSKINDIIKNMTIEEKVAQMFFVHLPSEGAVEMASQYSLGGFILFANDFDGCTSDEVKEKIAALQRVSKLPLLIGVDEEGGRVVRMSSNPNLAPKPFPSQLSLYEMGGIQALLESDTRKIEMLKEYGVNVNFAPVCDMTDNPDDYIYSRTLGGNAEAVAECIAADVALYKEKKLGCVLKHFPGYGGNSDTHKGMSLDKRSLDDLCSYDIIPFKAGIEAGAPCVMMSHNVLICMDSGKPASVSDSSHKFLREELDFDGCIITDSLTMGGITEYCASDLAALLAVRAGNDLLCTPDFENQYPAVLKGIKSRTVSETRINEAVRRILKWKENLGLI